MTKSIRLKALLCILCGLWTVSFAQATPVLQEDFSAPGIDSSRWVTRQAEGGSWTAQDGQLQFLVKVSPANWSQWSFATSKSYPRKDEAGQCLSVSFDVAQSADAMYLAGLVAADSAPFAYQQMKYLFHLYGGKLYPLSWKSFGDAWAPAMPIDDATERHTLRITLDPVKGALYEINDGSGWSLLQDTRGRDGDNSPAYYFALITGLPGGTAPQTVTLDNVRVEYISAPPAAAPTLEPMVCPIAVGLTRPDTLNLAGEWNLREDPKNLGLKEGWFRPGNIQGRRVQVPLAWQLAAPELEKYAGVAWYEKAITIPASYAGKRIALCTHGIAKDARIWVNGQSLGEKKSVAQSPFVLDITPYVQAGADNTITIRAADPAGGFVEVLTGVRASGLWREIWIEASGKTFIADAFMKTDLDHSSATARVTVCAPATEQEQNLNLNITCTAPDGKPQQGTAAVRIPAGGQTTTQLIEIPIQFESVQPWSPETPILYQAEVALTDSAGRQLDRATTDFGFRKLENRDKHVWLNNKPYYLLGGGLDPGPYGGALDANWHMPPPHHPLTDEEIQSNIRKIKSLGVNFVRCTLRPAPPRFLYWADRLGLLVWEEAPWYESYLIQNDGRVDPLAFKKFECQCAEVMMRNRNHPSLAMFGIFNEGIPIRVEPEKPVTDLFRLLKDLNPGCFILDTSGGRAPGLVNSPENHLVTDVEDLHTYPHFYHFSEARNFFKSNHSFGKPILVTEFGSIPYIHDMDKNRKVWNGQPPAWVTVLGSAYATFFPRGYEDRFYKWGMDKVFDNFTSFTTACDWYYYEGLKHHTELMRMNPEMSGSVAWIFESWPHPVGAFDYYWEPKAFAGELHKIWAQDLVIPDITGRRSFWSGEPVQVEIHVSHFGDDKPLAGELRWRLEGSDLKGSLGPVNVPAGGVIRAGAVQFTAPETKHAQSGRLVVTLESAGKVCSENFIRIDWYPVADRIPPVRQATFTSEIDSRRFQTFGFQDGGALVTTRMDAESSRALTQGATVILLANPNNVPFLRQNGLVMSSRAPDVHTATYFIKRQGDLFRRIPFKNPLTWPFQSAWPQKTIAGFKPENNADLLGGAFGMMLAFKGRDEQNNPLASEVNATILQARCGKGRLIITTFDLLSSYGDDPVATIMLNDLIAYAGQPFEPALRLN